MFDFDSLSNEDIRRLLVQYGLANIPVTDTTRKILIKKLKLAMEQQKKKNQIAKIKAMKDANNEGAKVDRPSTVIEVKKLSKQKDQRIASNSYPKIFFTLLTIIAGVAIYMFLVTGEPLQFGYNCFDGFKTLS